MTQAEAKIAVATLVRCFTAPELAAKRQAHLTNTLLALIAFLVAIIAAIYVQLRFYLRFFEVVRQTQSFRSFLGPEFRDWMVSLTVVFVLFVLMSVTGRRRRERAALIDQAITSRASERVSETPE